MSFVPGEIEITLYYWIHAADRLREAGLLGGKPATVDPSRYHDVMQDAATRGVFPRKDRLAIEHVIDTVSPGMPPDHREGLIALMTHHEKAISDTKGT